MIDTTFEKLEWIDYTPSNLSIVQVAIQGISPLLMNRFHEEAQEEASSGHHQKKKQKTPEEDAQERLYFNDSIGIYMPAENLRQALIAAATRHKIGRRNASTDAAAAIYVSPYCMPFEGNWEIDGRAVVIPATKGRITRYRPIFPKWRIAFEIQVDENLLGLNVVRAILDDAGIYCGLGDYRPAKKGPHGRFIVVKWEEQQIAGKITK